MSPDNAVNFLLGYIPAQLCMLHCLSSLALPSQTLPPFLAIVFSFRTLFWVPPPQDLSHSLQSPNAAHSQSTTIE